MKDSVLTGQQEKFCQVFASSHNVTNSAVEAGYSDKSAYSTGSRLLKKARVRARIVELREEIGLKYDVTRDRIVRELAAMAFSTIKDVVEVNEVSAVDAGGNPTEVKYIEVKDFDSMEPEALASIAEIYEGKHGIKVKLHDKRAALDSLTKILGLDAPQKVEHSGQIETQFWIEFVARTEK